MKLYTLWRSSAAYRVRIALALKGLNYESIPVALTSGEQNQPTYRARNPQGLVPALDIGSAVLNQSLAIIEYLNEQYPNPPLLPADPLARAQVRSMALLVACDIHPLNNLRVLNYLRQPLGHDEVTVDRWYAHWIAAGLGALEQEAQRFSAQGRFLHGDSVSIADTCLVPQMYNARRFKCDVSPYPRLQSIDAHLRTLPAFAGAAPEQQPDAPR